MGLVGGFDPRGVPHTNPGSAPNRVALGLLDAHAHHRVLGAEGAEKQATTDELMAAVGRLMRRG
jgi:CsoR family transcriptional regulator, copper-sensing transcriptional repressor